MASASLDLSALDLSEEDARAPDLLDRFRRAIAPWSRALFDPATGGFRQSDAIGANPLASSDMVWIRYAVGHAATPAALGAPDPPALVRFLRGAQDPATGAVRHDRGPGGQGHADGHALWQVVRALRLLGADLPHAPGWLLPLASERGLAAWFDARDWSAGGAGNHHEVLALVPLLASVSNADRPPLVDTLLRKIGEQQDPRTGAWPRDAPAPNVSRTFAYTALHLAAGRLPDLAPRIVDAILEVQRPNGLWDPERPHFHTMDAAFLLVRLPPRLRHREAHARTALRALARATRDVLSRAADRAAYAGNPHAVLALAHTLGLLQETFPGDFPSGPTFRFDWETLSQYASPVLGQAVAAGLRYPRTP